MCFPQIVLMHETEEDGAQGFNCTTFASVMSTIRNGNHDNTYHSTSAFVLEFLATLVSGSGVVCV